MTVYSFYTQINKEQLQLLILRLLLPQTPNYGIVKEYIKKINR